MLPTTTVGVCTLDECDDPLRSPGAIYCKKHYHRWYRHGDPRLTASGVQAAVRQASGDYVRVQAHGHPLASATGQAFEHRIVLYAKIGPGSHPCHWCGRIVRWARKAEPGELVADHVDGRRDNNAPENLVPSCRGCNTERGLAVRSAALRAAGWFSNNDTVAVVNENVARRARGEAPMPRSAPRWR